MKVQIYDRDPVTHYYKHAFIRAGHEIVDKDADIFFTDTSSYHRGTVHKDMVIDAKYKVLLIADAPVSAPPFINEFDLGITANKPKDLLEIHPWISIKLKYMPWSASGYYYFDKGYDKTEDVSFIGGPHHDSPIVERVSGLNPTQCSELLNKTKMTYRIKSMQGNFMTLMPFEASACKCMCFQKENTNYLREIFTKREMVGVADAHELKELVDYYLRNEEERQKIVNRAYDRVMKEHLTFHRVKEMEGYLP